MALRPPRISEAEDQNADSDRRAQPIRPVWQGALIWLFGIGLLLVVVMSGFRFLLVPALSGPSAPSAAEAHLSALQTQEALTPQPTTVPVRVPTSAPAVVPTAVLAADRATADRDATCYDGTHTTGCSVRNLERRYTGANRYPQVGCRGVGCVPALFRGQCRCTAQARLFEAGRRRY